MKRLLLVLCCLPALAFAQEAETGCDDPRYALLDFWVGEWTVWSGDEQAGVNRIEKILGGCALLEHWHSAAGGEGKSLFYVDSSGKWRQVWVTARATAPGGVKEKSLVTGAPPGAVRFRGRIETETGSYLDRTTLVPLADGTVRQLIEVSTDGGETWRPVFDAIYRPGSN